jgi:hypothetical protein
LLGFDESFASLCKVCKKWWATTILLSQTNMFLLFFIQFYFAGSHTEHHLSFALRESPPELMFLLFFIQFYFAGSHTEHHLSFALRESPPELGT